MADSKYPCETCKLKKDCAKMGVHWFNYVDCPCRCPYDEKEVVDRMPDIVNHPSHYESGKFECIEVMLETQGKEAVMNLCLGNAFKYLYRHNRKNGIEDILKARWYIEKYIELREGDEK